MSLEIADKESKRAEILDAAIRTFARKGFHGTRTEDVAREAGVAKGTLYLYFASRDEIFTAAFERFTDQVQGSLQDVMLMESSALERLRSLLRAWLAQTEVEPELSRLMLDFLAHGSSTGGLVGVDFGQVYAGYRDAVGDLVARAISEGDIRDDLPRNTVAAVVIGAIEGIVLQWIVDPNAVSPTQAAGSLSSVVFDGLVRGDD